ncbi:transcription termination factor MTEF1, chloroplastic-like [Coffea eugenioides]|uniref:transcription termination factor MTEF1, chloroplastic-like n=1 Tax=Coffea eugenioides TaxID=49369 RepID=UPI000F60E3E1|nr:transcription termination factor MTEF1, chloroplastic-like [Coffea eugenioides]
MSYEIPNGLRYQNFLRFSSYNARYPPPPFHLLLHHSPFHHTKISFAFPPQARPFGPSSSATRFQFHLHFHPFHRPPSSSSQENNNIAPPLKFQLLQEKLFYLDSLGLDSLYCLAAHSPILFTPLSQIKSLVKFLHSLGLTTPDLRRSFSMCPDLLATPLRTVLRPAVTFLLREAHVSGKDLRHVINRRPRLLTCSVDRRLRPALYFLRGTIGIDDVSRCAPLLSCCVESKFIPRLDYFLKLGIPKREAISLFRRFPSLFCYSIEENLEPKFNYFVVEMGRELRELVDFPHYFLFSLENRIKSRHKMCVERGVCLSLPVMLKSSEARFMDRLEVCCDSSVPLATSPLWCKRVNLDIDVT